MTFDRTKYFDAVRQELFQGTMSQRQVDGQNAILDGWEEVDPLGQRDHRHLAYMLATTYHETSTEMWPIEEYGKGSGYEYGKPDPQTGQTYYGRGYVQLTWRDNYRNMSKVLGLSGENDLEWHAQRALDPDIAYDVMDYGMMHGSFRPPNKLDTYFNDIEDDPYGAREIINGDKSKVPSWSGGVSIGNLIAGYHDAFRDALEASWTKARLIRPRKPRVVVVKTRKKAKHRRKK